MIIPGYNVYEFNSALEEINKNAKKISIFEIWVKNGFFVQNLKNVTNLKMYAK
jgi:hypothetical protein